MPLKIDQSKLIAALLPLVAVASRKTTMPILNNVRIESVGGRLSLSATDLESYAVAQVECEGDLPSICIPAKHLLELVNAASKNVELKVEKDWLHVDGCKLAGFSSVEFPAEPTDKFTKIAVNCEDLATGIESVGWAASEDQSKYILQSVNIAASATEIVCMSGSPFLLAKYAQSAICAPFQCLTMSAHAKQIAESLRVTGAVLSVGSNWIKVEHENGSLACKQIEGKYPDVMPMFKGDKDAIGKVSIAPLKSALGTIMVLAGGELCVPVKFNFSKSGLDISYESKTSSFPKSFEGKFADAKANINAKSFIKIVSAIGEDCEFSIMKGNGPMLLETGNLQILATQLSTKN